VSGLASALTEARDRLEAGGIRVAHSGRWLGDTPEGSSFDWFLRCEGVVEVGQVGELLGANRTVVQTAEGRLAVLEQHLLEMRAALARLADELVVATRAPSTASLLQETRSANHDAILEATRDRVRELETRLAATPPNPAPARSSTARLQQELGAVLVALRPDVILLRDSLQVAVGEFASRTAFYRTLQELPVSGARPEGWKALRGSERWCNAMSRMDKMIAGGHTPASTPEVVSGGYSWGGRENSRGTSIGLDARANSFALSVISKVKSKYKSRLSPLR